MKAEGTRTKGELLDYEARVREFQKVLSLHLFVLYETGTFKAMGSFFDDCCL